MKTTLIGEVFVEKQGYIHVHTGSEFSRHPEGLSFLGLRSEFSRSEFSSHPSSEVFGTSSEVCGSSLDIIGNLRKSSSHLRLSAMFYSSMTSTSLFSFSFLLMTYIT